MDLLDDDDALGEDEKREAAVALGGFRGEARTQLNLALPVSLSMICNRVMSLTSVAFVGHLGSLPLAGAALATTLGNVTGNSVLVGMASAISTIGGQAYGAGAYATLGHVTQRALLILTLATLPIAALWSSAEPALLAMGQDPDIARAAAAHLRAHPRSSSTRGTSPRKPTCNPNASPDPVRSRASSPRSFTSPRTSSSSAPRARIRGAGAATSWSNGAALASTSATSPSSSATSPGRRRGTGGVFAPPPRDGASSSGWRFPGS